MFESTFNSETRNLDHLSDSHSNPTSPLHSSSSLTHKTNTPNEDDTYEERTPPSCLDPADEQYSSPAKVFVNRKLEVLRVKLETLTETNSAKDASDSTVQTLMQTDTSLQYSWQNAEKTYTEACLGRLNVSEHPSVNRSRSTQSTTVSTTKPFIAQCERLKMESLQHMMEMQIKVG